MGYSIVSDEGQFRFTNGSIIDEKLNADRLIDVVNHELTHAILYSSSTYGQMILMLEKNSIVDEKSKMLYSSLFKYMNRMQERTAVNVELMIKCVNNGMQEYNRSIELLKDRNNVYYNYFRKLCCINGKIANEDDANKLTNILIAIAKIALNVNLDNIPLERFKYEKDVDRYFTKAENAICSSPNRRFDILINTLFRNNNNDNNIELVLDGGIPFEYLDDNVYIHDIAFNAVTSLYSYNLNKNRLIKRIESVGQKEIEYFKDYELLTVKPAQINENKSIYTYIVKSKSEFINLLHEQENKFVYILNSIRGFEDFIVICIYLQEIEKRVILSYCMVDEEKEEFFSLLSTLECKFVFYKTKVFGKDNNSIRKMVKILPVYIYEDTPLLYSLDKIGSMFL